MKMKVAWIGIDPGLDGALAMVVGTRAFVWDTPTITVTGTGKTKKGNPKHKRKYEAAKMAVLLKQLIVWAFKQELELRVGIELVSTRPKLSAQSVLQTGRGVGLWEGMVTYAGLAMEVVTPQSWKKELLGKGAGSDKNLSILKAQTLFPGVANKLARKKDDGRAEAILIAEYFRRRHS
jgi:crossover junction endodeoxyribonuclease RuvC